MQNNNVLMSLAVCNIVDKEADFENKLILSDTISEIIEPIVKEQKELDYKESQRSYSYGKDKELPKTVTDEITERRDKINTIKKDKAEKILVMLGQMYNGVIIPEKLSCRRGKFFRYRCQYPLGLNSVKQELLGNLHEVSKKITVSKNLDILEYCLNAWDRVDDEVNNYHRRNEKDRIRKDFRFDDLKIVENTSRSENSPNVTLKVIHINGVSVIDNGDIEFFYKMGEDRDNQSFQTENFNALYNKFSSEIKKLAEEFIKQLDDEIKKRTENLNDIKLKGSHLLMSAELQKGSDDMKGYGN